MQSIKRGIDTRVNSFNDDMRMRIEKPDEWHDKDNARRLKASEAKSKQLEWDTKLAKQQASIAKNKAAARKYEPAPDYGFGSGGGEIFDLGGGPGPSRRGGAGNDSLFDMGGGGGGLFDLGIGGGSSRKPHNKKHKKSKGGSGGKGIHIHINK
jgi:hypothetical protein